MGNKRKSATAGARSFFTKGRDKSRGRRVGKGVEQETAARARFFDFPPEEER